MRQASLNSDVISSAKNGFDGIPTKVSNNFFIYWAYFMIHIKFTIELTQYGIVPNSKQ